MRSLSLFTPASGKCTLFEIRLDNNIIVFRGNDHEAAGQLLKGTVVLCLCAPLKLENIHLKLTGTAHYTWTDAKVTASGISTHKVDKTLPFFEHRWPPFVGVGAPDPETDGVRQQTKGVTLPPGNYEWPFELMLGGDTTESVEGIREASIRYRLKATIARGKLQHDIHVYRPLRIIRTLDASALEFLHAMSIENIWPNKIEYSIVVPQKAIVFGSAIPLEMRFTPLMKGLEIGDITIRLLEVHEIILQPTPGHSVRDYHKEREIDHWTVSVTRDEHWRDIINDDNGPEGWVVDTSLDLPKKLARCLQDVNAKGIKIRHKLKLVVALNNPDGHVSELRATLPVMIFISPNMPLDDAGNLVRQLPNGTPVGTETTAMAPPSYDDHRLDQLYEDMEPFSLHSPIGGRSGVSSPLHIHSRAGSTDNLPALVEGAFIQPDLLASRLHSMSLERQHRNNSWNSNLSAAGTVSRTETGPHPGDESHLSPSAPLTRHNSNDDPSGPNTPPEHIDFAVEITALSRVPSYHTAVKTPVKPLAPDMFALPDYQTALSAPSSPPHSPQLTASTPSVTESPAYELAPDSALTSAAATVAPPTPGPSSTETGTRPAHRRHHSSGLSIPRLLHMRADGDEARRLQLLQSRGN
ncbi:uncharacterized protein B0T15DRAFT_277481 [Chaetomium strumarium]|uniref:Arrestin C-terminal-like domain-containing protein n=1 Tax=Chaetomium strumarium TaxID=1170767 RepID=A0AAJ0LZJ9_9PEZI|nr:hypothetical protein B0T15DRAFT_277481 [Chaetomium strumarium]